MTTLLQVNTRVWLTALSACIGRVATLEDVEDAALDEWQSQGVRWIWLLSVWQTGEASRTVSRHNEHWLREYRRTLPDLTDDDIQGSGFAITEYTVHSAIGGKQALARFRQRLAARGIKLMLDFVPNHMGLDPVWLNEGRNLFMSGTEKQLNSAPQNYTRVKRDGMECVIAHGRDPYFDGWPDTLQLDYSRPETIDAMQAVLLDIASQCDGLRCDMAMLVLPEIFERTWGKRALPFWPEAIAKVRQQVQSDFCFLAEVYWDMEYALQQQGFDYAYDKRLLDRLIGANTAEEVQNIRAHLSAPLDYQSKLARFLENHDERRIADILEPARHRAAALITYTLPGMRFFHDGQWRGCRKRVSPHLVRSPVETPDAEIVDFYQRFLSALQHPALASGQWQLLACQPGGTGNETWKNFIVGLWLAPSGQRVLSVANYSAVSSQCHVPLAIDELHGHEFELVDLLTPARHRWQGNDITSRGIYFDEPPWRAALFVLQRTQ